MVATLLINHASSPLHAGSFVIRGSSMHPRSLLLLAVIAACGTTPPETSPTDAGTTDAGTTTDAGSTADAGPSCDGWVSNGECKPFTACDRVDTEGTPTSDRICLVDCELTWSAWGCCSLTSDPRTQARSATVAREPSPKGAACPEARQESRACEAAAPSCACDTASSSTDCRREATCEWLSESATCRLAPIDCEYSPWSSWSDCTYPCDLGQQTRTRTIVREAANGGKACNDPLSVTQACNGAIRCECSTFAVESQCTAYEGCGWNAGACVKTVVACDTITDEASCNASPACCEFAFGSCVPKTCE